MSLGRSAQRVFVERINGQIIRIFRRPPYGYDGPNEITEYPRKDAVEALRRAVFTRSNYECEWCGYPLTWSTGHMHEKKFRSQGGEQSLENCVAICYDCHEGRPDSPHGNRLPRSKEKT